MISPCCSLTFSPRAPYASTATVTDSQQLTASQKRGYDVWVQLFGAKAEAGSAETTLWVGYTGAHYFINPDLLVGGLLQLDWSDSSDSSANTSSDGFGWMFGPYLAGKVPGQNLFFDARASWGRSHNDLTTASSTGSFETERWLVSAKLSGLFREDDISIRPAISVSYFEETQESYVDSLSNMIPEQTFTQGEVRFGPTFSYDYLTMTA